MAARRCWSCTTSIPRRKLSTVPSPPGARTGCPSSSGNLTSSSSPWARPRDGHDAVDLRVRRGMLSQVADGVLIHESELFQSNAVVVRYGWRLAVGLGPGFGAG